MNNLLLLHSLTVKLKYKDAQFDVLFKNSSITIYVNENNYATLSLLNQQVPYKINILGGFALGEDIVGKVNYKKYFSINWDDDNSAPEIVFNIRPLEIKRDYRKGQKIELDVENVTCYHVVYKDTVTADFTKTEEGAYNFNFSTGLKGNIWKDTDGAHSIKFKGIRLDAEEDGYDSESKLIISRSKYTNNLILVFQEDASVHLVL